MRYNKEKANMRGNRMIKVGAVNIDTSHPMGFGEVMEKNKRMKYVGVFNNSFRQSAEIDGFMKRFNVEKHCNTVGELADICDIGFIHGCNWDEHLSLAQEFWKKGKPVFIDKPLAGNLADCQKIKAATNKGAVLLGCSSARYAYELQEFLKLPCEERGEIVTVMGTAGVDEFNYGIHIVEAIGALLGTGAQTVKYLGRGEAQGKYSEGYYVQYKNGKSAIFNTFTGVWQPFEIVIMTTKTSYNITLNSARLYEALITEIGNYMENKSSLLASTDALIESVQIMLAGTASRKNFGQEVALAQLKIDGPAYDGKAFWNEYSAASGQMYAL